MVQTQRDPWRTASILLAFLIEYNVALAIVHFATAYLFGESIRPTDRVWDFRETHIQNSSGYRNILVSLLTAAILVPVEVVQIARAKLVLDFAMTAQASHLLLTWRYSHGLPYTWSWWMIWLLSSCIMVFGGEYACMQIELRPIQFGTTSTNTANTNTERTMAERQSMQEARMSTSSRLARLSNVTGRNSTDDIELQERDKLMEEGQSSRT